MLQRTPRFFDVESLCLETRVKFLNYLTALLTTKVYKPRYPFNINV